MRSWLRSGPWDPKIKFLSLSIMAGRQQAGGGTTMAGKTKPHAKGSPELCKALKFVAQTNLDIAEDQKAAGDMKGASASIDIASEALQDYGKWGCGEWKSSRMHKRIAALRAKKRGRSPAQSRRAGIGSAVLLRAST